jgi:hypothetical protein
MPGGDPPRRPRDSIGGGKSHKEIASGDNPFASLNDTIFASSVVSKQEGISYNAIALFTQSHKIF